MWRGGEGRGGEGREESSDQKQEEKVSTRLPGMALHSDHSGLFESLVGNHTRKYTLYPL